uniref:Uncharacterized protein n=1 Tax=Arundo donax TaxID=35708 RepID=A0A0A8Y3W1_ARUDO
MIDLLQGFYLSPLISPPLASGHQKGKQRRKERLLDVFLDLLIIVVVVVLLIVVLLGSLGSCKRVLNLIHVTLLNLGTTRRASRLDVAVTIYLLEPLSVLLPSYPLLLHSD